MTFSNQAMIAAAVGFVPGQREMNKARMEALLEESDIGETFRAQLRYILQSQMVEYSALDLELGFSYWRGGAVVPDGSARPAIDPQGQNYAQTSRPGHRLPHVWLEERDDRSQRVFSTHDLIRNEHDYLLITDQYGSAWIQAIQDSQETSFRFNVGVAQIGPLTAGIRPCSYVDREDRWPIESQLGRGGAVLVRPDNFIAWRQTHGSLHDGIEVVDAFKILAGDTIGLDIPVDPYDPEGFMASQRKKAQTRAHLSNGTGSPNGAVENEDFITSSATNRMKLNLATASGTRAGRFQREEEEVVNGIS